MSAKRTPTTHYRVAGRDEPNVQVEKYRSTPPQQTKKSNGTKRRRKGPRIETFRAEGTLDSDAADTKLDLAHAPPDQKLADPSSSSAPLLDNVNDPPGPAAETDSPGITPPNRTNKTANQFLASWLVESSGGYLTAFYDNDSPPDTIICSVCQKPAIDLFRCRTCLGGCRCCSSCLLSAHRIHPTHRTERWDGQTWVAASLDNLGYVLHLGHQGQPCTVGNGSSALLVGDLNGFHTIRVHYCTHNNAAAKPIQLISAGLFPCSDVNPQSAFAISLLEIYNVFLTVGRTSAHKFYSVLERITKPGFPDDVKDRYRELMATHRKYLFLLNLQRAAHGFELHETDIHPGDQALDCAACPRPGINFDWSEVSKDEHKWFRAFVSYDGNFRSVRKNKKVDADDICLSDGKAYFAPKGPYKEWVNAQKQPQRSEKPACDRHKAGNDTSVRSTGKDITGIGALTCTSHSCFVPRGIVDYFRGELYIYLDYALACAVRHLSRGEPLPFGLTYDVWCHWIKKLWDRIPNLPPDLQLPDDFDLVGAIPKWHLIGHIIECHIRHSLDHKQHVGRMEGEGPERVWSNLNEHSGSTSEQGPGVRTDTINNLAYEWNYEKMIRFIQYLPHKAKEAKRMYIQQEAVHQDLSGGLPTTEVTLWEAASIEPVEGPNKTWTSPLMDPVWTDGLFQKTVRAESQKESPTSRSPRGRPGVARWLSDAIELENHMRRIHDEAKALGSNPTPRQSESLDKSRIKLRNEILAFKQRASRYMGPLVDQELDHPDRVPPLDDDPEHWELGLPSSYSATTLATAGLSPLAELEKELRRGVCNDALASIRQLLGARAYAINYKNRNIGGEVATTRSQATLRGHSDKIAKARWRYENSHSALLRLGPSDSDKRKFRTMTDSDMRTLKEYLKEVSQGVGQGYVGISWVWCSTGVPKGDKWQLEALKTEWFRSRERYKRWKEQLFLLKREMTMTIRTFRKWEEVWKWKAQSCHSTPGMRAYAFKQSRFYGEHAIRALRTFRPYLEDDIVTLNWSQDWLHTHTNGDRFIDSVP